MPRRWVAAALVAVAVTACGSSPSARPGKATSTSAAPSTTANGGPTPQPPPTPAKDECASPAATLPTGRGESVLVDDAEFPTALAWAPDGRLFFAERAGTIKIVSGTDVTTFVTVPTVTSERGGGYSERGLLGLAVS